MSDDVIAVPEPFEFIQHWMSEDAEKDTAVTEFWRTENALGDEAMLKQRLREVVLHARNASGEIAAVCTAVAVTIPRLAQPLYYYRCFVGRAFRSTRLVKHMLKHAQGVLENYARANQYPCIGVLLELENTRFTQLLRKPVWRHSGFVYIGKSKRNLDLRVSYFRGAQLKN